MKRFLTWTAIALALLLALVALAVVLEPEVLTQPRPFASQQ